MVQTFVVEFYLFVFLFELLLELLDLKFELLFSLLVLCLKGKDLVMGLSGLPCLLDRVIVGLGRLIRELFDCSSEFLLVGLCEQDLLSRCRDLSLQLLIYSECIVQ